MSLAFMAGMQRASSVMSKEDMALILEELQEALWGVLSWSNALILLATATAGYGLLKLCHCLWRRRVLSKKRVLKRAACQKALDQLRAELQQADISVEERTTILSLNLVELIAKLQSKHLTALKVLQAYQFAALEAHSRTNCLVEPIVEAKAHAMKLDECETRGPLHGVPVSIKDCYGLAGYESTLGCANLIGQVFKEDAVLIKTLKELGAVPFVKTNVPQTMMAIETSNPIFGETTCPAMPGRHCGGSSGGEAALIGGGGSILGLGGDVGGSLRIPAAACGITVIKPTFDRLSGSGGASCTRGQHLIKASYGPMAQDVDSIVLFMRLLLDPRMFDRDISVPRMPFNNQAFHSKHKMRIGVFTNNGLLTVAEPCQRALNIVVEKLRHLGHEIVEVDIKEDMLKAAILYGRTVTGDQCEWMRRELRDDVLDKCVLPSYMITCWLNNTVRKFIAKLLSLKQSFAGPAALFSELNTIRNVDDWWQHSQNVLEFRQYMADKWKSLGLEAVIAPVPVPAMLCGDVMKAQGVLCHYAFWNVLNFPVGVLPVTKVTEEDEEKSKNYPTPDPWHYIVKKSLCGMVGLPVGVQVAALPWQEETCLRVMKELETALKQQ